MSGMVFQRADCGRAGWARLTTVPRPSCGGLSSGLRLVQPIARRRFEAVRAAFSRSRQSARLPELESSLRHSDRPRIGLAVGPVRPGRRWKQGFKDQDIRRRIGARQRGSMSLDLVAVGGKVRPPGTRRASTSPRGHRFPGKPFASKALLLAVEFGSGETVGRLPSDRQAGGRASRHWRASVRFSSNDPVSRMTRLCHRRQRARAAYLRQPGTERGRFPFFLIAWSVLPDASQLDQLLAAELSPDQTDFETALFPSVAALDCLRHPD